MCALLSGLYIGGDHKGRGGGGGGGGRGGLAKEGKKCVFKANTATVNTVGSSLPILLYR